MVLGSGIRKKPIPDPGARGQKAPDPGSATLEKKICHKKWRCWLVHLKSFDLNNILLLAPSTESCQAASHFRLSDDEKNTQKKLG
jgi:hypothetical protein